MTLRPTSLAGQLALLVALALFAAQAINFGLLLAERRERSFNGSIVPAITRLVDAAERVEGGERLNDRRARGARRVTLALRSRITDAMTRVPAVEARLRAGLDQAGIDYRDARVATVERASRRRTDVAPRVRTIYLLSAQLGDGRWLGTRAPVASTAPAIGRLLAQTALIYALLLLAVLWIGRRAARPLAALTRAADRFGRGGTTSPVPDQGPADVRRLIAAFNAMETRLAAMLRDKDQMLGAIGHDLRTPLASLRLRAEAVADEDDRVRMVATIEEMDRMLDDILSLARIGHATEPASRVDFAALTDALIEDLRELGHPLTFEHSDRIIATLKPDLVRRALRNLLDNAVKYGGGATVRVRREGMRALVEIDDDGPGIPADRIDAMFEGFARLEDSRSRDTGGAGLGLTLARAVVHDGGGDVTLANRAGGGLRATLWLPVDRTDGA